MNNYVVFVQLSILQNIMYFEKNIFFPSPHKDCVLKVSTVLVGIKRIKTTFRSSLIKVMMDLSIRKENIILNLLPNRCCSTGKLY